MHRTIDLTVVVVTHNGRDRALETLRSAHAAVGPIAVEWIVVDSGSTDGVADAIEQRYPEVRVHRRPNVGFAAANNVALREAGGRHVLLLNPDVDIARGTLADLVAAMDARPTVGAASVVQIGPDGQRLPSIRRYPSARRQWAEAVLPGGRLGRRDLGESEERADRYERESSVDWLVGAFLVLRREALQAAGPFDERFFLYSEETDLCRRVRAAGWDVRHLPELAIVHHLGGYERPDLAAQLAYSKLLYARKHLPLASRASLRAALAAGHAVRGARLLPVAARRPVATRRLAGERRAIAVALGFARAPMGPTFSRDSAAPQREDRLEHSSLRKAHR